MLEKSTTSIDSPSKKLIFNLNLIFCLVLLHFGLNGQVFAQDEARFKVISSEFIFTNPPFKQCHASSLVELSDGSILATWFGGTHERNPDVCIWTAKNTNGAWSEPKLVADGVQNDSLRFPTWNPVLFKNRSGQLFLFYKVGPSPREWWGMYKVSNDEGKSWSQEVALPAGILGPIKNKPIYVSAGRIISPSSTETNLSWSCHMEISDDEGKTWSRVNIDSVPDLKIIQPTLLLQGHRSVFALMRSNQNRVYKSYSNDNGSTWSVPEKTNVLNPNSGIDALTLKSGLHVLISNPAESGNDWSDGRAKLALYYSIDGEDWKKSMDLEEHKSGEFSYPAVIQSADGLIHITYTYNRENIKHLILSEL